MRQVSDAEIDRLAAALARLLADWWQTGQQEEANARSRSAGAETTEHSSTSPGVPEASSMAIAALPSQEVEL